jgi:DNA polymerase elongation subunit (family B)
MPLRWRSEEGQALRILDFDIETVAAGFADPDWVPQKITCVAWSWIGSEEVEVRISTAAGLFGRPELRARMLRPLLAAINEADMLTGHNILRFDLPVLNSECLRLGLPTVPSILVQDTMKLGAWTKGFKKGQDNLGRMLKVKDEKLALDWQAWQDAYDEKGWVTIKERCVSDIRQHKQIRAEMIARNMLAAPRRWRG